MKISIYKHHNYFEYIEDDYDNVCLDLINKSFEISNKLIKIEDYEDGIIVYIDVEENEDISEFICELIDLFEYERKKGM